MIHLGKILVKILPWDPWLARCSKNLARSCQDSQDASETVNPGIPSLGYAYMEFPKKFRGRFQCSKELPLLVLCQSFNAMLCLLERNLEKKINFEIYKLDFMLFF